MADRQAPGQGRGRGEPPNVATQEPPSGPRPDLSSQESGATGGEKRRRSPHSDSGSGSGSGEHTSRGRAGYRCELSTIPRNVTSVRAQQPAPGTQQIEVLTNFVRVTQMPQRHVYQYRVDFEPDIEARPVRRRLFFEAIRAQFGGAGPSGGSGAPSGPLFDFDGTYDARSAFLAADGAEVCAQLDNPTAEGSVCVRIRLVGSVDEHPLELIRLYNINMKSLLRRMGFFAIGRTGAHVHPQLAQSMDRFPDLMIMRGYRSSAMTAEKGQILMNLEAVHKIIHRKNLLAIMTELKGQAMGRRANVLEALRGALVGKLVATSYNKMVYRIEDVTVEVKVGHQLPGAGSQLTYLEYYKTKHNLVIKSTDQPLIRVVHNNRRRQDQAQSDLIYLVPELCNLAGLTDEQRNNPMLRNELIRVTQVEPAARVQKLDQFLTMLHANQQNRQLLDGWGYDLGREPVKIGARQLATESVIVSSRGGGTGARKQERIDAQTAGFDGVVLRERLAVAPQISRLSIVVPRNEQTNASHIINCIRQGFQKIGLNACNVDVQQMGDDSAHAYTQQLRQLADNTTIALVIMTNQNKQRYDAIKRLCTMERGLLTQVVTAKLMLDQRKAAGAAVKIGVQMAAKCGGEPWHINLPLKSAMICGYDTYHDTANRNCSYGAFVASLADTVGAGWFSKTDRHDHLDELTGHLAENFVQALEVYQQRNRRYPDRVFFYRDGVGDGQLEHVYKVELKKILAVLGDRQSIRLTYIVVNKRVGARFYLCGAGQAGPVNCRPGTVVDDVVTRQHRFDFYLISQSTRHGTVAPTYYNIIYDDSGMDAAKHQAMAFKLCLVYYNWTGSVRVPAPCQYAHKLAHLCGEHLHGTPHSLIEDRLHFL